MHLWEPNCPIFFFFFCLKKRYLTDFLIYIYVSPKTQPLNIVQPPGPSSRDILGETHLLNIGKLAKLIEDLSFLRKRHKVP